MFQKPMAVQDPQVIKPLSKRTDDISFALAQTHTDFSCGFRIVKKDHPKLIIYETIPGPFANNEIKKNKVRHIYVYQL